MSIEPQKQTRGLSRRTDSEMMFHKIRPDATNVVDGEVQIEYYAYRGETTEDVKNACAKRAFDPATNKYRYWVLKCVDGAEHGNMLNKNSPTFSPKYRYEFASVSQEAFESYITFLRTGRTLYLYQAQRS